jgi:uncharacterized protein (DUF885 family)
MVEPTPEPIATSVTDRSLLVQMENRIAARLYEDAFQEMAALDPELQTLIGIDDRNGEWTSRSPKSMQNRLDLQNFWWSRLQKDISLHYLDFNQAISYKLFKYNIERSRERLRFQDQYTVINPIDGLHLRPISFLINHHPANSVADLDSYIDRIRHSEQLIGQMIQNIRQNQDKGLLPTSSLLGSVINQVRLIITGFPYAASTSQHILMDDFRLKLNRLGLLKREQTRLLDAASNALMAHMFPAYQELLDYLLELQSKIESNPKTTEGLRGLAEGEAFYRHKLQEYTTIRVTPEQLHLLGQEEVDHLLDEVREARLRDSLPGEVDGTRYFPDTAEGRQQYLSELVDTVGRVSNQTRLRYESDHAIDLVIKPVEAFREETVADTFYTPPSRQGAHPGILYVNFNDQRSMKKNEVEPTIYHDVIPGLHLLHSRLIQHHELPSFRKSVSFPFFESGWAAYVEKTYSTNHASSGEGDNPTNTRRVLLGKLSRELVRASLLVVDTGIHWQRWTDAKALEYLAENTFNTDTQNQKLIQLVKSKPGQSAAQMVGLWKFMELDARARDSLGDHFSLEEFHGMILSNGPLPWHLLEASVDAWISHTRKKYND